MTIRPNNIPEQIWQSTRELGEKELPSEKRSINGFTVGELLNELHHRELFERLEATHVTDRRVHYYDDPGYIESVHRQLIKMLTHELTHVYNKERQEEHLEVWDRLSYYVIGVRQ